MLFLAVAALCYILGQLGFISWVPEYAKGLGMSLNDAGALVSDFWMSYMFGMWAFSFILRFFDLQRILTVLAGMATVLMYLFITGTQAHMPWFILTLASSPAPFIPPSLRWDRSKRKWPRLSWSTLF
ncbi:TsgA protein -like protein [Salmonella enterica subsp. arizonae]|uniref:TsgA protein -like protein n=1 Tax=Salmonella enterica subsp. arizonae TaxID=59203 RepID=A0A379RXT3_SALER|nr:TsgA protein -like protein [Salmonella enterica subsp. arizonae]